MDPSTSSVSALYAHSRADAFDFYANTIHALVYGVHATLFFICFIALVKRRRTHPRQSYAYIAYILTHFVFATTAFAAFSYIAQVAFVVRPSFPEGPHDYLMNSLSYWSLHVVYILYMCTSWLQDLLLIWRCCMFWNHNVYVLIVPFALVLASFATGSVYLVEIGRRGVTSTQSLPFHLFETYWAVEITTTTVITTMIAGKLIYTRCQLKTVIGKSQLKPYLTVAAMVIESGILFSVAALGFLVSYACQSPFQSVALCVVAQITSIAPLLIILRVAQGDSITQETSQEVTIELHISDDTASSVGEQCTTRSWTAPTLEEPQPHEVAGREANKVIHITSLDVSSRTIAV
ncbi:hypothetical protein EXIGLDRAFT_830404 [Exidia glandulosa HHB12029]|uniref:Uncharacterized protein n=1 Tax=Exidia glandulosa HHB12029 TaxID=1314781 RepID=A0A165NN96_EXIGL|nr:hypothetical protein EXIGLDRAFT_830404 [Exidia glandulosa HHB12029]